VGGARLRHLDLNAVPLLEYLEAVPADIVWCNLGDFRCYATLTVDVDANWKTITDGFSETYHIQTLHPELMRCVDDIHAPQQIWGHTGKSEQPYGVQSPRFEGALMGATEGTPFPADERQPGQTVQDLIAARTRAFAAERGVDLDWADTDRVTRLHQYNVFPNMTLLTNADHLTIMCSRPGPDPDHGEMVMFLMTHMPPGAPRNKPTDVRTSAGQAEPGLVLTQDIRVLAGLQRGMHQPGFTHVVLSSEERRVINMHRNLERYLDLPESERMTGGGAIDQA
jgi:choline monooxygenase